MQQRAFQAKADPQPAARLLRPPDSQETSRSRYLSSQAQRPVSSSAEFHEAISPGPLTLPEHSCWRSTHKQGKHTRSLPADQKCGGFGHDDPLSKLSPFLALARKFNRRAGQRSRISRRYHIRTKTESSEPKQIDPTDSASAAPDSGQGIFDDD